MQFVIAYKVYISYVQQLNIADDKSYAIYMEYYNVCIYAN